MKALLSLIISTALVVSGYAQTRNVLVGTNNSVVQPTNFWSADAINARSGLGLGSAATNPSSAFQPASSILSNLVSGGSLTFSNITVGISNVTGLQTALDGKLGTNPTLFIANISNLQTTLDGKLGTNPTLQISNIVALQTALDGKLSGTFPIAISNVSGLQSSLDGKLSTNPTLAIANITGLQTNLDSKLSTTGNAANLTNFPTVALASNITGTAALASNITGVVALTNGGTGATNASGARTAFGVGASDVFVGLTNLGSGGNLGFSSSPYILGSTNSTAPNNAVSAINSAGVRSFIGHTLDVLTNTTISSFRSDLGLGWSALTNTNASTSLLGFTTNGEVVANTGANVLTFTNDVMFASGDVQLSGAQIIGNGITIDFDDGAISGPIVLDTNSYIQFLGTSAATTRTNLGLGWSALTNTNASTSLLGFTTNGEVVANTGTNVLTFTNPFSIEDASGSTLDFVFTDESLGSGYGDSNYAIGVGDYGFAVKYSSNSNDWGQPILVEEGSGVVAFPSSTIEFIQPLDWVTASNAVITRTNLGLGWSALTNTNSSAFQTALFGSGTNPVLVATNGEVVSPTNFWQVAPIVTTFIESQPTTNSSTNISASRLLHIHSLSTNIVNVTNTIVLPTNTLTFEGDMAMVVHKGSTNSLTQVRQAGSTNNLITLNQFNEAVEFTYYNDTWQFLETAAFTAPIYFSGTNASVSAAASRTNLGLGATWLTNTNVTNFRTAVGLGAVNNVEFTDITAVNLLGAGNTNVVIDLDDSWLMNDGSVILEWQTNAITAYRPLSFNNTTNAATTRTNLGIPLEALTNTSVTNFQKAIFYTNTAPSNIGGNLGTIAAWIEIVASNGITYKIPAYTNVP